MPDKAQVTSIDALESFRASLITYVSKARPTLEEISSDVLRTRLWLENEQRLRWENQVRRRTKDLEQAQQALSSARLSSLREENAAEQNAVRRAKGALEEAGTKLKLLKQWHRDFENRVEPLAKQLDKLHTVLANDMPQAAAYLAKIIQTLSAYAQDAAPAPLTSTTSATADGPTGTEPSTAPAGQAGHASPGAGQENIPDGDSS